jgi:hypothetical protein
MIQLDDQVKSGVMFPDLPAYLHPLLNAKLAELLFDDQDEHHQICQEQQQLVLVAVLLQQQPTQNTLFQTN